MTQVILENPPHFEIPIHENSSFEAWKSLIKVRNCLLISSFYKQRRSIVSAQLVVEMAFGELLMRSREQVYFKVPSLYCGVLVIVCKQCIPFLIRGGIMFGWLQKRKFLNSSTYFFSHKSSVGTTFVNNCVTHYNDTYIQPPPCPPPS